MTSPKKTLCKYGSKCYRRNPQHLKDFSHPDDDVDHNEPVKKKAKIDDYFGGARANTKADTKDGSPKARDNEDRIDKKKNTADGITEEKKNAAEEEGASNEDTASVSEEVEEDDMDSPPPSPADVRENIKQKFLVEMPEDFYDFWEFAKSINPNHPTDILLSPVGLQLVGPFDVLAGKCKRQNSRGRYPCYLRHWRYYYDPPEFLTVIKGDDKTQFHMGYFRDDPSEMPAFVASNAAKDNCRISPCGENLFAAVYLHIEDAIKKDRNKKEKLSKIQEALQKWAEKKSYSLEAKTKSMKAREKKVVCKSFHGAGVVVPVDDNEVGYRPVPETPADLKKMFKKIKEAKTKAERDEAFDPLMEIIMLIQFANDECDYGEGLELGLDMFSYGGEVFHSTIMNLLPLAYQLLGRHQYADIIKAHLKNRRHVDLSELA